MVKFGITMPVKAHIIAHHLSDYFELTGATLRKCSDQVVESAHHKLKTFFESRPNYNHQNKETVASGKATLHAIAHFNSVQIWIKPKNSQNKLQFIYMSSTFPQILLDQRLRVQIWV